MTVYATLRAIFGDDLLPPDDARLKPYRIDQVGDERYAQTPTAVVFPTSTTQVADLMKWANQTGTAVTPRGGGSGLSGAAIATDGGIVCSFEKMNRISERSTRTTY